MNSANADHENRRPCFQWFPNQVKEPRPMTSCPTFLLAAWISRAIDVPAFDSSCTWTLARALCFRRLRRAATPLPALRQPRRLKNWTARSCFIAASLVLNVPKLRRLPVWGFFLRE
jgi:hypothetical protein